MGFALAHTDKSSQPSFRVQKKLTVGAVNDPHEKEADQVADKVMRMPCAQPAMVQRSTAATMVPSISRKCSTCSEEEKVQKKAEEEVQKKPAEEIQKKAEEEVQKKPVEEEVQRKAAKEEHLGGEELLAQTKRNTAMATGGSVGGSLATGISASKGGGSAMSKGLSSEMGGKMGADFSGVRIHTGGYAQNFSKSIGAKAFTVGNNIYFNSGEYNPHSAGGKHLLAHELTHTVQQGAVARRSPETQEKDAAAITQNHNPSVQRGIGDWLADQAWGIVEEITSPTFVSILREIWDKGIITYLSDKIKEGLNHLFDAFPSVGGFVNNLISVFAILYQRVTAILGALMNGDCAPLLAAVEELKNVITEVATNAWNDLVEFVSPIGEFFSGLWTSYGAPVMQWLGDTATDVWNWMQSIGQQIWDWTSPVREYGSMAWDWVKSTLGFGSNAEGEENSNGIVQWISDKASEAWTEIKTVLDPVITPVIDVVHKVEEILPLDAIMNLRDTVSNMAENVNSMAGAMGDDGSEVAAQQASLRDTILPAVQMRIVEVRDGIANTGIWIGEKVGGFVGMITGFYNSLATNQWLSFAAPAISWISETATALGGWVQNNVISLFQSASDGLGYLATFIEPIFNALQAIVDTVTDLVGKAGDFILGPFMLIPECIRTPIKNFLLEQILGRIPLFSQIMAIGDIWSRAQQVCMTILYQVFVDGNIFGAMWTFFRELLSLVGIPPELIVSILANASSAVVDILANPVAFFMNLLRGLGQGFTQFFDNIGTHLLNGVVNWLTGQMESMGITPPADFSFGSIFGFILQILGITIDNIFRLLARRIGEERAGQLRRMLDMATGAWTFIRDVVERGPAAIWERIQEQLSNLWNNVITQIITYITERIIAQATIWLLGLLDISGIMPVVNSIIAIYRAVQSFVEYFVPILRIVDQYVGMLADVARGNVDGAANFLEQILANSLPIMIGFLAAQFGFGSLARRMTEILAAIRERIDNGILWVIDQAIRVGGAIMGAVRSGVSAVTGWVRGLLGLEKRFRADDETEHRLFFREQSGNAQLMVNPDPVGPFSAWVNALVIDESTAAGRTRAGHKTRAIAKADEVDAKNREIQTLSTSAPSGSLDPDHEKMREQRTLLDELSEITGRLFVRIPACATVENGRVTFSGSHAGYGVGMVANGLSRNGLEYGSRPTVASTGTTYDVINRRRYGNGSYYVKGHLLNDNLGGKGNNWNNLTPLKGSVNTAMHERIVEARVKNAVDAGNVVNYNVTAVYDRGGAAGLKTAVDNYTPPAGVNYDKVSVKEIIDAEMDVPSRLICNASIIDPANPASSGAPLVNGVTIENTIEQSPADYSLIAGPLPEVRLANKNSANMNSVPEISSIPGLDIKLIAAFTQRETEGVRFPSYAALATYRTTSNVPHFTPSEQTAINSLSNISRVTMH